MKSPDLKSPVEMRGAGWILLGVAALWMSQLLLVSSDLNCSVTQQPDGFFKYKVSQPHASSCDFSWADVHDKVIANHLNINETLVQNLTNQSITMKTCSDLLRYTADCSGVQVMTNCPDPVNPDWNCSTSDWPERVGLYVFDVNAVAAVTVIAVIIVIAVITVVVCLFIYKPRRVRQTETVSYSAPSEMVNLNQ